MSGKVDVAVKLPKTLKARLEALARETDREQNGLVEQAVARFLEREERHIKMIREAVHTADHHPERLVDDAAVEAWIGSLGTKEELTIEIDEETFRRLALIGKGSSLSERQVAERAIRWYCDSHERETYIDGVRQGQEDLKNGNVVGHEELVKELESRLADLD